MLILIHEPETGAPRLIIHNLFAKAWISPYRRPNEHFRHLNEVHNWRLWVERSAHLPPRCGKSPTGILIESHLRAWLLQRFRLKLRDLRFEELCAVAKAAQKHPTRDRARTGKGRTSSRIDPRCRFERPDLPADRRRRHRQLVRGLGDALVPGSSLEGSERVEGRQAAHRLT